MYSDYEKNTAKISTNGLVLKVWGETARREDPSRHFFFGRQSTSDERVILMEGESFRDGMFIVRRIYVK